MTTHSQAEAFVLGQPGGGVPKAVDITLTDVVLAQVCSFAVLAQVAGQVAQGFAIEFQPLGNALGPKTTLVHALGGEGLNLLDHGHCGPRFYYCLLTAYT